MVRLKTRWLLVQVELMSPSSSSDDDTYIYDSDDGRTVLFPSKKELVRAICDNLLKCSGVAASGAALDTQGKERVSALRSLMRQLRVSALASKAAVLSSVDPYRLKQSMHPASCLERMGAPIMVYLT